MLEDQLLPATTLARLRCCAGYGSGNWLSTSYLSNQNKLTDGAFTHALRKCLGLYSGALLMETRCTTPNCPFGPTDYYTHSRTLWTCTQPPDPLHP